MELGPAHISVNRCHSMHIITEPELEPFPSYITLSLGGHTVFGCTMCCSFLSERIPTVLKGHSSFLPLPASK